MIRRAFLLSIALGGAALAALGGAALAQTAGPPPGVSEADRTAIRGVISRQLEAFKRGDAAAAYQFAGPAVRQMFPSPEIFIDMVRRGYPPVYRPRDIEFSELALREDGLVQEVELVGPDGKPVLALYTMVRGPNGTWLIAACSLIASVRVGV